MLPTFRIVPPIILSPTSLLRGILSPVSIDSSIRAEPQITAPSTGILSPSFTIRMSFTTISSKDNSLISPSSSFLATPNFIAESS